MDKISPRAAACFAGAGAGASTQLVAAAPTADGRWFVAASAQRQGDAKYAGGRYRAQPAANSRQPRTVPDHPPCPRR